MNPIWGTEKRWTYPSFSIGILFIHCVGCFSKFVNKFVAAWFETNILWEKRFNFRNSQIPRRLGHFIKRCTFGLKFLSDNLLVQFFLLQNSINYLDGYEQNYPEHNFHFHFWNEELNSDTKWNNVEHNLRSWSLILLWIHFVYLLILTTCNVQHQKKIRSK